MRAALAACIVLAGGCVQAVHVDDGRVRMVAGSYRSPVVVTSADGRSFALALRTDRTPHEVWAAALDGSGACSLGPVRGSWVWYDAVPSSGNGLAGLGSVGPSSVPPLRFVVGDLSDGFETVRFADEHCHPVRPTVDGVLHDDDSTGVLFVVGSTGTAYALETRDKSLHLVDPWAGTDTVIARNVTKWGGYSGTEVWGVAGGKLHFWYADGTEVGHVGTAVTEVASPYNAYIEGGNVWTFAWAGDTSPRRLTTGGDACHLRAVADDYIAYFAPCDARQLNVASLRLGQEPFAVPGATDVVSFYTYASDAFLLAFYATAPPDGSHHMWVRNGWTGSAPIDLGPWRDVLGFHEVPVAPPPGGERPGPASSTIDYLGLEAADGTGTWGVWDRGSATFHPLVAHVSGMSSIPGALIATTDVAGGIGTVRFFAPPTGGPDSIAPPLLVVPGVAAGSVHVAFDEGAVFDLEHFDPTSGTGDLVMRDIAGDRLVIDHRATGYADVFFPIRGFVYTVSGGPRAGLWLAVTGTAR